MALKINDFFNRAPAPVAARDDDEEPPTAASYRIDPATIREDGCQGRDIHELEDFRWSPSVWGERQCTRPVLAGYDLCKVCIAREHSYAKDPTRAHRSRWFNRITEEPPGYTHMLGTVWAAAKQFRWKGKLATPK
jgi:hypothetical protein